MVLFVSSVKELSSPVFLNVCFTLYQFGKDCVQSVLGPSLYLKNDYRSFTGLFKTTWLKALFCTHSLIHNNSLQECNHLECNQYTNNKSQMK